jgi:hypothetical protein
MNLKQELNREQINIRMKVLLEKIDRQMEENLVRRGRLEQDLNLKDEVRISVPTIHRKIIFFSSFWLTRKQIEIS